MRGIVWVLMVGPPGVWLPSLYQRSDRRGEEVSGCEGMYGSKGLFLRERSSPGLIVLSSGEGRDLFVVRANPSLELGQLNKLQQHTVWRGATLLHVLPLRPGSLAAVTFSIGTRLLATQGTNSLLKPRNMAQTVPTPQAAPAALLLESKTRLSCRRDSALRNPLHAISML